MNPGLRWLAVRSPLRPGLNLGEPSLRDSRSGNVGCGDRPDEGNLRLCNSAVFPLSPERATLSYRAQGAGVEHKRDDKPWVGARSTIQVLKGRPSDPLCGFEGGTNPDAPLRSRHRLNDVCNCNAVLSGLDRGWAVNPGLRWLAVRSPLRPGLNLGEPSLRDSRSGNVGCGDRPGEGNLRLCDSAVFSLGLERATLLQKPRVQASSASETTNPGYGQSL